MESSIRGMDYSSVEHDKFLVQALSQIKSVAVGSCYTKVLSKTSELLNIRRILIMANNDISWEKRKYHQLQQQTTLIMNNQLNKKLKEHNMQNDDGRRRLVKCLNPNINKFVGARQDICITGNNSITSLESRCNFSRTDALRKLMECSVTNRCEPDPGFVILQDSSNKSSRISKEWSSSDKTGWKSSEESIRQQDGQTCDSSIDSTNISTSNPSDDTTTSIKTSFPKHGSQRRSNRLTSFVGDRLQAVVPIGDNFQASIPNCIGPLCYDYNLDNSRWLGETIWPQENKNMDTEIEMIGKGRSDSSLCSCMDPDSSDCIKLHIQEKKSQLQFELGDAYYLWDFNGMGEEDSKSWTVEERDNSKIFLEGGHPCQSRDFGCKHFISFQISGGKI